MSQPWKLLPLAVLVASALILGGFSPGSNHTASAEISSIDIDPLTPGNDSETSVTIVSEEDVGDLVIQILGDGSDFELLSVTCPGCSGNYTEQSNGFTIDTNALDGGSVVETLTTTFTFTIDCDEDDVIQVKATDDDEDDTATVTCHASATTTPTATATTSVTVTPTVGPAAAVTVSASPQTISCTGTSIVTIQVRDSAGAAVPPGTVITVTSTIGTISPSAGTTADNSGNGFLFLTGVGEGGTAVVTAKSGTAEGSTNVTIDCGAVATATTPPPPTATTGGVISPPNTGSAGLASENGSQWALFATIGLIATLMMSGIAIKARA